MASNEKYTKIKKFLGELDVKIKNLCDVSENKKNFSKNNLNNTHKKINDIFNSINILTNVIKTELEESSGLSKEELNKLNQDFNHYCIRIKEKTDKITEQTDDSSSKNNISNLSIVSNTSLKNSLSKNIYNNPETLQLIEKMNGQLSQLEDKMNLINKEIINQGDKINVIASNYEETNQDSDEITNLQNGYTWKNYAYSYILHILSLCLFGIIILLVVKKVETI